MSNLDKVARDKLPKSSFALPDQRLYPILDQDDVDSAARLIGKHPNAKAGVMRLAKAKGLKIPDAWKTADMSTTAGMVIKRGKIFEAGDYPDKRFSITPEEMAAAVETFAPVPVRDTHLARETSLLDGKLGHVQGIALDAGNPYDLIGEVAIPSWLDDALTGTDLSVSAEWDRETKQLAGLALVTDPAIADAALFAAFAKATHNTPQGQSVMQDLHDGAARAGAVCNPPADFASKHEATATQQIHDITVEHGATCASGSKPAWYAQAPAANTATATAVRFSTGKEKKPMSFGERFKAWFTGGMVGDLPLADDPSPVPATFGGTPAPVTPDPEKEAMKAQIASLTAARFQAEAVAFADTEIAAHRAYPAEREALIAAFSQASHDDATGAAQFSGDKSRVQLLRDAAGARPAHALTTEQLAPEETTALFNQMTTARAGEPKPMSAERKAALLGMTGIGKDVLAARNGAQR